MKKVSEMSDEELKQSYALGKGWLEEKEQVTGTDKNAVGEKYEGSMYLFGIGRIEALEKELQRRNISYG